MKHKISIFHYLTVPSQISQTLHINRPLLLHKHGIMVSHLLVKHGIMVSHLIVKHGIMVFHLIVKHGIMVSHLLIHVFHLSAFYTKAFVVTSMAGLQPQLEDYVTHFK